MNHGLTPFELALAAGSNPVDQMVAAESQRKMLARAGYVNTRPNVSRQIQEDVAKRVIGPFRSLSFDVLVGGGADALAPILAALLLPIDVWNMAVAIDRQEIYGDILIALQADINCTATMTSVGGGVGANTIVSSSPGLADAIEQALYKAIVLGLFPSSGNTDPVVRDSPLSEFAATHNLAGPSGYRAVPPTPFTDQFGHIELSAAAPPVNAARTITLDGAAGDQYQLAGEVTIRVRKMSDGY